MQPDATAALVGLLLALFAPVPLALGDSTAERPSPSLSDAIPEGPSPEERLAEIHRRIREAVVYPPRARSRGLTGESEVEFRIGADGSPVDLRVSRSSGSELLDRAAERAVTAAAPFPPLYGLLVVPIRFDLEAASGDAPRAPPPR